MQTKIKQSQQKYLYSKRRQSIKLKNEPLKKSSLILVCLYVIYLSKSALGINISDRYTLPKFFKLPLVAMDCMLPIEGNYCHQIKAKISSPQKSIN